jgi:predicted aconitase
LAKISGFVFHPSVMYMNLTIEEQAMLDGRFGRSTQKAMQILVALGKIYAAPRLIPVSSVQIAGVSYDNLGEAGLQFLAEMAEGGGKARVLSTLNPAGMDIANWQILGIPPDFAEKQQRVLEAFERMGVITTCTCTPYLVGNLPSFGEHIAWSESSAVCYANSVLGARSNREGGPSALAAALTGCTPEYGFHLNENRRPGLTFHVTARLSENSDFGALGKVIGDKIEATKIVPNITGVKEASLEQLKSFCASLATYGGAALFHIHGLTPETSLYPPPAEEITITQAELDIAYQSLNDATENEVDFVSLGCPHLTLPEIARIAGLLDGKRVSREFWITTARPVMQMAEKLGYTQTIQAAGAKIAADTCCVVAPNKGRFTALATDSAKACYYAAGKNQFKTRFLPFDEVVRLALRERQ